jgi:hypothetical protein
MTFCKNCGKRLISGVRKCGYCEEPLTEEEQNNIVERRDSNASYIHTKKIVAVIGIFLGICSIITWDWIGVIAILIGYFWIGPWCANIAEDDGREPNSAFVVGALFGLLGLLFYWVWVKLTSVKRL